MIKNSLFFHKRVVLPCEVDGVYHHVHHATIFQFLEEGRAAWLESLRYPLQWFFERDLFWVVSGATCSFLRELREEEIQISQCASAYHGKILTIDQEILLARGKVAVRAQLDLQCFARCSKRSIPPPQEFIEALRMNTISQ
jgi:acyl-CoA thioesterase FadM